MHQHVKATKDPLPLFQRYRLAAHCLRWHDQGIGNGVQKRLHYLAVILEMLAHQIEHQPVHVTRAWIERQLEYERTHNFYAYRLLRRVRSHLIRDQD